MESGDVGPPMKGSGAKHIQGKFVISLGVSINS